MTDPDLAQLERLFQAAADLPAAERDAYLEAECPPDLRGRLRDMLAQLESGASLAVPAVLEEPGEGPGDVIGRYKLLEKIGEGGFGLVFMAEQTEPVRRKVALKVIKLGMDTREVIARFEAERQALALMDHPNIAKVLDGGKTQSGRPYFVMELVNGVSVTEYCDKAKLVTSERLRLFQDVCNAVQHAHQKGIIHRDLKPSNVLVTLHDGRPVPKVIDFGIAKAMHTPLTEKTLFTAFQRFLGTPAYMSPEQAEMSGLDVDTRADIYSLGVLLYELLTGTTPIDPNAAIAGGLAEMQRVIREEPAQRPSLRISTGADAQVAALRRLDVAALSRALRGDLDWIVLKCLEKDRTRRYATASELATDVERHLNHEPVEAGPPSAVYRMRKLIARNRAAVLAVALSTLALVGMVVGTTWGMVEAGHQRDKAVASAREAAAVTDFLVETLALANPEVAMEPDVTVRSLLDQASRNVTETFAGRERAEARVRATIGLAYHSMGDHIAAEAHLRRATSLMDELGGFDGKEHYDALWTLTNVAFTLERPDSYGLAQKSRRVGLAEVGREYPELAAVLDAFRQAAEDSAYSADAGAFERARTLFTESSALAERRVPLGSPLWPIIADTYKAAALALWFSPFEAETEKFYAKAIDLQRRYLPPNHPAIGTNLGLLVGVLNRAGKLDVAEARVKEALELLRSTLPEDNVQIAYSRAMLGETLMLQGRHEEAVEHLEASHAVIAQSVKNDRAWLVVESQARLVQVYSALGDEAAYERNREALATTCGLGEYAGRWPVARWCFDEAEYGALLVSLDRLHAIAGGISYAVRAGSAQAPDLLPVVEELVAERRRVLPEDDVLTAVVARSLIGWANAVAPGEADAARRLLAEESVALLRRWRTEVPMDFASALAFTAELAAGAGDRELGARRAREAWEIARGWGAEDSWFTASAKVRIARALMTLELYPEAESLLLPSYGVLVEQFTHSQADAVEARRMLNALYTAWGRPERARAYAASETDTEREDRGR